ncbi:vanadium-dependent haloperoxidase [Micromonospora sp. NPDC007230]|uniref:vanadium-dependent haloperoxidase n=1 Tax=Micromonospora sp. NPDC007230 TaxID=3364237 RepID=UPI0036A36A4E
MRRSLGVVLASLLAAIGSLVTTATPAAANGATTATIHYWNDTLLEAFRRQGGGPGPLARAAAMMHTGIFDIFTGARWVDQNGRGSGYRGYTVGPSDTECLSSLGISINEDLAAGFAARDLLIDALPAQRTYVEGRFTARYGTPSPFDVDAAAARCVVDRMRSLRGNDGANATPSYVKDNTPGAWRETENFCAAPVTPHWGSVLPFVTGTSQFRPAPPGGHTTYATLLASELYANQLKEVKDLGRVDSTIRTDDQTQAAWFWANDLDRTYKPPGQLLAHTRIVAAAKFTDVATAPINTARLFARVSLAMADASIAAWDRKYRTSIDLWRPETAIHLADTDNNPATDREDTWQPLSANEQGVHFSPCFPAWMSGHATFAGAWAGVMRTEFGDSAGTFTLTTEDPHASGVVRSFSSFTAAATENAFSRIYLGVHFRFDGTDGLATGLSIGEHVTQNTFAFVNV